MAMSCAFRPEMLVRVDTLSKFVTNPNKSHLLENVFHNSVKSNITLTNKCYSSTSDVFGCKFSRLELETLKLDNMSDQVYSSVGLVREAMPKHIAISLDGNRRWLKARGRDVDYRPFFDKNMVFAELCLKWGVPTGSSFQWGLGNFTKRGEQANNFFFGQFQEFMEDNLEYFKRNGVKVMAMGETSLLSKPVQKTIRKVEDETRNNTKLELSLPICYTGQRDLTNATRKICEKVKQGVIQPCDVTEHMIEKELSYSPSTIPDLFIRTGGELRVGAMLTWQVSHTELYFTQTMAPDFCEDIFVDALRFYQQRNRKFGK